ncbi:putative helicase MOV-10 [Operophtera brumata]|uniref:Putative helicase MOV-10 n=1 Tax=Operophtera brumata TaxID=104452 RepID=A0A0L7LIM0_OPEBR|nr:putative helicase MOV-10 [Operophtera brumata]
MSRVPMERCHTAVSCVFSSKQIERLFPEPRRGVVKWPAPSGKAPYVVFGPPGTGKTMTIVEAIIQVTYEEPRSAVEHIVAGSLGKAPYVGFGPPGTGKTMTIVEAIIQVTYEEQRSAVEHIVAGSSGKAPDVVFGPPGTGKTMTIVEAIIQVTYEEQRSAVEHIVAGSLGKAPYVVFGPPGTGKTMTIVEAIIQVLAPVSNGTSYENFVSLDNVRVSSFRIVVTTLLHAAKYSSPRSQSMHKLKMSHLFIDEASQSAEPNTLVPITGLLAPTGQLVLAGDPKQLGPVCISKEASGRGLGKYNDTTYWCLPETPNSWDLFAYPKRHLAEDWPLAPRDPISGTSILGLPGGDRAIVYFNEKELDMLKRYVKTLIDTHKWRLYMDTCREYDCYYGLENQQLERTSALLTDIAKTRFDKCGLTDALKEKKKNKNQTFALKTEIAKTRFDKCGQKRTIKKILLSSQKRECLKNLKKKHKNKYIEVL